MEDSNTDMSMEMGSQHTGLEEEEDTRRQQSRGMVTMAATQQQQQQNSCLADNERHSILLISDCIRSLELMAAATFCLLEKGGCSRRVGGIDGRTMGIASRTGVLS